MENWSDIEGYEGIYQVSDQGRVKSLSRKIHVQASGRCRAYSRNVKERILTPCRSVENGQLRAFSVTLWLEHEGWQVGVHVLVLTAFVGPRPEGLYGCHRDDNPENNVLNNLYWGTPKENSNDKKLNGNQPYGEDCTAAKLTLEKVEEMRSLKGKASQEIIGQLFGVGQPQVSRIINKKQWA